MTIVDSGLLFLVHPVYLGVTLAVSVRAWSGSSLVVDGCMTRSSWTSCLRMIPLARRQFVVNDMSSKRVRFAAATKNNTEAYMTGPQAYFVGRRSNVVELFTGPSPWSSTEFWQFSRKPLKTRNYLRVIKHIKRSRDASRFDTKKIKARQWHWYYN